MKKRTSYLLLIETHKKENSAFKRLFMVLLIMCSFQGYSQEEILDESAVNVSSNREAFPRFFQPSATIYLQGMVSTGERLPFWMYHNQRGRIEENTSLATWITATGTWNFSRATVEVGGGLGLQDGINESFFIDELYAHFKTDRFYLTGGRKHEEVLYNGLSASNRSVLWSLNARAMPGLKFGTNRPLFLNGENGLGIEGSWNEFIMEEDRHMSYARVHHKNLMLVYRTANDFQIKLGGRHIAQWAGTGEDTGPQPGGATEYLKIIAGRERGGYDAAGGEVVLANQLGSYELYLQKDFNNFYLEFFYNHIFEDVGGMMYENFPDGRYGFYMDRTGDDRFIDKILYELTYTRNQNVHSSGDEGASQNYFKHGTYQSGWTYKNRIIGSPFFDYSHREGRVVNNKFVMHHIGISGVMADYFIRIPYRLMVSGGRNDGTYENRYYPNEDVVYINSEFDLLRTFLDINLQFAAEFNSTTSPIFGVGVQLRKRF